MSVNIEHLPPGEEACSPQSLLNSRIFKGVGDVSVGEVFTMQAGVPEFRAECGSAHL